MMQIVLKQIMPCIHMLLLEYVLQHYEGYEVRQVKAPHPNKSKLSMAIIVMTIRATTKKWTRSGSIMTKVPARHDSAIS